ncbi:hypothetical protein DH2020_044229 [Rehmannia glutinosa]|uniref:Endoglucanase n=1 Tax=Rehmannia glutinosa TaxID=99300 RepID=A0ABR0UHV9_REHGL
MAYTITMLSWSVVEFGRTPGPTRVIKCSMLSDGEPGYLIKAHREPDVLYGEVGDGVSDHACWQRPEDMTTPRTAYRIDAQHPGADLAGRNNRRFCRLHCFQELGPRYSFTLLNNAKMYGLDPIRFLKDLRVMRIKLGTLLFDFARNHPGVYQNSIPVAGQFYTSSGYEDELVWAAAWLERATNNKTYTQFITRAPNLWRTRKYFSWDAKFVGAQVLIAKGVLEGKFPTRGKLGQMKGNADQYICNLIQKEKQCAQDKWWTSLVSTRNNQVDYILGSNPNRLSYMVGFGPNYPKQVHHRGASIVSIKKDPRPVGCGQGYVEWFNKNAENPNVIIGAIVAGPDQGDKFNDSRQNPGQTEPSTYNNAPFVGVLARLAS